MILKGQGCDSFARVETLLGPVADVSEACGGKLSFVTLNPETLGMSLHLKPDNCECVLDSPEGTSNVY